MSSDTDLDDEGSGSNPRLAFYKSRTWKSDQESRRCVLLEEQKKRREDCYNAFRDISSIFNDARSDDGEDFSHVAADEMDEKPEKAKYTKLRDLYMLSEWMTELPAALQDDWLFVMCPVGMRCLVQSCKGSTTVYGKKGYKKAKFKSRLPNGGYHDPVDGKYSKSDVTVLDCIWCGAVQTYFILDVLYWKGQPYLDTDVGFRSFWIKSKVEESPEISEKSKQNPYPFVPLNYYPCDLQTLSSVMCRHPYFGSDKPEVDGVLFYHREGYYTPGVTPLVLWLKPYMLAEVFGCDVFVAEEYFSIRPSNYTNMQDFIVLFEEARKKKKKRWKGRRGCKESEMMELVTEEESQRDEVDCDAWE